MKHLLRKASQVWGAARRRVVAPTNADKAPTLCAASIRVLCRAYHFSSPVSDPATLRLYRILLRQCRALVATESSGVGNDHAQKILLVQPPLNPHLAGLSRVFVSSLPQQKEQQQPTPHDVLRLVVHWRQWELKRQSGEDKLNGKAEHEMKNDQAAAVEQDKLQDWLESIIMNTAPPDASADPSWSWRDKETLWTKPSTIEQAIRLAFRASSSPADTTSSTMTPFDYRTWTIRAYQYLSAQTEMNRLVRVHDDPETGVRITTLARCVGRSASVQRGSGGSVVVESSPLMYKYRFVYRIRIENTSSEDRYFQLLGRSWIIQETHAVSAENAAASTTGAATDSATSSSQRNTSLVFDEESSASSIRVHAPHTGAVGKHPVLGPGQCFEYMSGCDLATPRGLMKGSFHFAWVPAGTPSAQVGQTVAALEDARHEDRFEVPVTPFPLEPDRLPPQFGT